MKLRSLILITVLMPCITFAQAANTSTNFKHIEVGVGGGCWSSDYLFDGYEIGKGKLYTNKDYSGTFFFNFKYFVIERFAISITLAYENESGQWFQGKTENLRLVYYTVPIGTFRRQAFTFSPEITFYYYKKGFVGIYGVVGIGLTYRNEIGRYDQDYYNQNYLNGTNKLGNDIEIDNSKIQPNGYSAPIGISAGKRVRWYAEIGLGYKGIFNSGISYNF